MNDTQREEFAELLRKWGANGLASVVSEEANDEVTTLEVYERCPDLGGATVHRYNIHPNLIEMFEQADVDGLAFKVIQ
jgi:hypothetical protein